ncbi:hypothetical protein YC2023_061246 [Brassica napus]
MISAAATLRKELDDAVRLKFPNAVIGQPWKKFTVRLGLHSQTTRLVDNASSATRSGYDGALTLFGAPFQDDASPD